MREERLVTKLASGRVAVASDVAQSGNCGSAQISSWPVSSIQSLIT